MTLLLHEYSVKNSIKKCKKAAWNREFEEFIISTQFICGVILFITGTVINWQSDNVLIRLKKPGKLDYKIPKVDCFTLSVALICLDSCQSGFSTLSHHRWYHISFANFPINRGQFSILSDRYSLLFKLLKSISSKGPGRLLNSF